MDETMRVEPPPEQEHVQAYMTGGFVRWVLVTSVVVFILAASLFISAGRLDWVMAWIYTGLLVVAQFATVLILLPTNRALIAERSWMQEGSKRWDTVLVLLGECGLLSISIVAGLDLRLRWSPQIPLSFHSVTLFVSVLGYALFLWAMASNRFFSSFVRVQRERGHAVAAAGPYQVVRHPGYVGGILLYLGIPIMLGSLWALIPAVFLVSMTIVRTSLEDRTLQAELDGYVNYTMDVRYRLLPGIW
jgi:protein-S-isoprenylcysteine O-methyltransferase Ste14